jgi:hypothetical protein
MMRRPQLPAIDQLRPMLLDERKRAPTDEALYLVEC